MAKEVFSRYESKFLIDSKTYNRITEKLTDYMKPDKHHQTQELYTVCNIYYDTEDNYLIRTSLSKPCYKEKLRLRSYGEVRSDSMVYLEIKKKYNGLVNKRRTSLKPDEAYSFIHTGKRPEYKHYMNQQVINEIEYILYHYNLKPMLYLAYDRKAYSGSEGSSLRITFDTNIRTRRSDLKLENGDYGEPLENFDRYLMEIKTSTNFPLWLTSILSDNKIYRTGFSKYGTEYSQLLKRILGKEENRKCSVRSSVQPQMALQYL